jgi:hypothetical protein
MRRRSLSQIPIAAALITGALALAPVAALGQAGPGAATPEDAVTTYLDAVAANDVEAILDATAVDEMAAGFDFAAYSERLRAMNLGFSLAPSEYPMYAEMNGYQQAAQILAQVRNLAYGLLSDETIDGRVIAPVDEAQVASFVAAVDPARLGDLSVLDIRLPEPEAAADERYVENVARIAAINGADELTERLALVGLDGETWGVGFTLLRYGDAWLVSAQSSVLGNTSALGTAEPMTRAEFHDRTS